MATISSAASALNAASTGSPASPGGKNEIAGNFQDFLLLLTTQLKNQSPLDPLDTNQFTQQLVQFAGVEQQLKTNDTLGSILAASKASSTVNAAGYVGLNVTADGSTTALSGGTASWVINAAKASPKATVTITDASGKTVASKPLSLKAGAQTFAWDGKDASGTLQPPGDYKLAVRGLDAAGQAVTVTTDVSGPVTAVDVSTGSPVLTVAGSQIPLGRIKTIGQ